MKTYLENLSRAADCAEARLKMASPHSEVYRHTGETSLSFQAVSAWAVNHDLVTAPSAYSCAPKQCGQKSPTVGCLWRIKKQNGSGSDPLRDCLVLPLCDYMGEYITKTRSGRRAQ